MSNATQILIGTTLALTAACGYMVYRVDAESERAAVSAQLAATQQVRLAQLDAERAALQKEVTRLREQSAKWSITRLGPAGPSPAAPPARQPAPALARRAGDQPVAAEGVSVVRHNVPFNDWTHTAGGREMMRSQRKMSVQRMYADLFREMNFTSEQVDRFVDVMVDQEMNNIGQLRGTRDPAEMQRLAQEREAGTRKELTQLLGADGYQEFEKYRNSFVERMELNQIADQLEALRTPLRDDQRSELLTAMIEERDRVPRPNTPSATPEESIGQHLEWKQQYDQRVRDRMASVLNGDQLKRLTEYQEMQANMQRMGLQFAQRNRLARGTSENAVIVTDAPASVTSFVLAPPLPPPPEAR